MDSASFNDYRRYKQRQRQQRHTAWARPVRDVFVPAQLVNDDEELVRYICRGVYSHGSGEDIYLEDEREVERKLKMLRSVHVCIVPRVDTDPIDKEIQHLMALEENNETTSRVLQEDEEMDADMEALSLNQDEKYVHDPTTDPKASESKPEEMQIDEDNSEPKSKVCTPEPDKSLPGIPYPELDKPNDKNTQSLLQKTNSCILSSSEVNNLRPSSSPELTPKMLEENSKALTFPPKTLIIPGKYPIYTENLATLRVGKGVCDQFWLDDTVIDFYLDLIRHRSTNDKQYPSLYAFFSTFYTTLSRCGLDKVKDTTSEENIFLHDMILFPVCVSDHWRLVVADIPGKTLTVYNSNSGIKEDEVFGPIKKLWEDEPLHDLTEDIEICQDLAKYLRSEALKSGTDMDNGFYNGEEWTLHRPLVPQQGRNKTECGVFVLQFAEYLSRRAPFDFTLKHMPYFRQKIMNEIISNRLLTSPSPTTSA